MDLNLHLPTMFEPTTAEQEREVLNRTRTWMLCYNLDRSTAAQLGKPMTIRDNYTIRHGGNWYKSSKFGVNSPFDIHLVGLTQLLGILSEFLNSVYSDVDHPTGLREDLDLKTAALEMDDRVMKWAKDEATLFKQDSNSNGACVSLMFGLIPDLLVSQTLLPASAMRFYHCTSIFKCKYVIVFTPFLAMSTTAASLFCPSVSNTQFATASSLPPMTNSFPDVSRPLQELSSLWSSEWLPPNTSNTPPTATWGSLPSLRPSSSNSTAPSSKSFSHRSRPIASSHYLSGLSRR